MTCGARRLVRLLVVVALVAATPAATTGASPSHDPASTEPWPTRVPMTLEEALDATLWVEADDAGSGWIFGSYGGMRTVLDIPGAAQVETAFGHVAGWFETADGRFQTFLVDPRTGERTDLVRFARRPWAVTPAPDGQALYVTAPEGPDGQDRGVRRVDAAGRTMAIPGQGRPDTSRNELSWSPDGRYLASWSCPDGGGQPCMVDILDTVTGDVTEAGPLHSTTTDGRHLIGHLDETEDGMRPWVALEVATGEMHEIATDTIDRTGGGWFLPDGTLLLSGFTTDASIYRIVIADRDTGEVLRVLREEPYDEDALSLRHVLGRSGEAPWALLWVPDDEGPMPTGSTWRVLDLRTGELLPDPLVMAP